MASGQNKTPVQKPALLMLADGTTFYGDSIGCDGLASGEVVFNTSMTGYQEILTDPSYCRQLVTLTYPHIGNVGSNRQDEESQNVFASGLLIRDYPRIDSNWRSEQSLQDFLLARQVIAIAGIDTRRLTRILREKGAQSGCIMAGAAVNKELALTAAREFPGLAGMDLAQEVSVRESYQWTQGSWQCENNAFNDALAERDGLPYHIVAYDFGIKRNILRLLADRGCQITVVPARYPASQVLAMKPDGVFLSNGPGDPEPCVYAIAAVRELLETGLPVFGICLGHQLLALACGARTEKMKFGHHGGNHPVQDLATGQVFITSQNHGFAVDESSLPDTLRATHRSLFDGTLQGIECVDRPAFSFQGHPEASPGPHDISLLFDRFVQLLDARRAA